MADNPWSTLRPNLSKIPAHLRQNLTKPIPMRSNEVHGRVLIASTKPGLNYPNGRVLCRTYHQDTAEGSRYPNAAVLEIADFTARTPLVSVFIAPEDILAVVKGLLGAYQDHGGNQEALQSLLASSQLPPKLANPLFPEEETE